MKYMKLGTKPDDAFQADGKTIRYVASELPTDITVIVGEVKFYLHKFPLLSKSDHLQKLLHKANEEQKNSDEITLADFPGGPKAFENCVKFCYGMIVTLNAHNVAATRCAAEYLEMTEDIDRGNLIFKIEVFLNTSIFRSWKDSIIVLQSTRSLQPWSENLKIVERCIDSVASKTSVDPAKITWSYTYNRKLSGPDRIIEEGKKIESVPKDWWVEDLSELDIDVYKRVITAIKSKGKNDGSVIGEALRTYAVRWLPSSVNDLISEANVDRNKYLVDTIVCLLPSDKVIGCPCSFLLKLLKISIFVGVDDSIKEELVNRISLKLHEASVNDLLIRAVSTQGTSYDVELIQSIFNRYSIHEKSDDSVSGRKSLLNVGKLIDGYLAKIAAEPGLDISRFIDLAQTIQDSARPLHDDLYNAVDVYLRSTLTNTEEWEKQTVDNCKTLQKQTRQMKIKETEDCKNEKLTKKNGRHSKSGAQLLPSRSRRIFDKLWLVGKGHGDNRSSETSGSSQSPTSMVPGDTKSSSCSSSRHRRHSIS
ncbi:hypothetical protein ACFE04_018629 [Oxalis oulophora]